MNHIQIRGSLLGFLCLCLSLNLVAQSTRISFQHSTLRKQIFIQEGQAPIEITDTNRQITLSLSKPVFGFLNNLPFYLFPGQNIEITDHKITGHPDNNILLAIHQLWQQLADSLQANQWPETGTHYQWIEAYKQRSCQLTRTIQQPEIKKMGELLYQLKQLEATRFYYLYTKDTIEKEKYIRQSLRTCDLNHPTLAHCQGQLVSGLLVNLHLLLILTNQVSSQDQTSFFRYLLKHTHQRPLISSGVIDGYIQVLSQKGPTLSLLKTGNEIIAYARKNRYDISRLNQELENYLPLAEGRMAPDFSFPDQQGKIWSLPDFRGKVVVVDIWATWCGGCVYGLPEYARIREKMKDNPNIEFITLSIDRKEQIPESREILKKAGLKQAINLADLSYSPDFRKKYHITYIPRCLIIDKQGKIVNTFAPSPHTEEFQYWIKKASEKE